MTDVIIKGDNEVKFVDVSNECLGKIIDLLCDDAARPISQTPQDNNPEVTNEVRLPRDKLGITSDLSSNPYVNSKFVYSNCCGAPVIHGICQDPECLEYCETVVEE